MSTLSNRRPAGTVWRAVQVLYEIAHTIPGIVWVKIAGDIHPRALADQKFRLCANLWLA
ncbi:hypothetical protein [Streptosporangium sp. NPDC000396]|uniref:hypothetical protein n=1 Tax=Streptosporangium sp. NPDC000396 TaxID=3366185 RepID=UPI00367623D7